MAAQCSAVTKSALSCAERAGAAEATVRGNTCNVSRETIGSEGTTDGCCLRDYIGSGETH